MDKSPLALFDTLDKHDTLPPKTSFPAEFCQKDFEHALNFLQSYNGSLATFNSYRREIEKLLQWSWWIAQKSVLDLKRKDIEDYIQFCQNPPLHWIGTQKASRYLDKEGQRIPNPLWRPFLVQVSKASARQGAVADVKNYSLSQSAVREIFAILSSYFNFLIQEEISEANPVALIRQKSKFLRKQSKPVIRRLSDLQWSFVIETAQIMAQEDALHERTLFIMSALYGMYLRISELAASSRWVPKMGDFRRDHDGLWWFTTVGKGNKERQIAVSDTMIQALKRYRLYLGLSELPSPGENLPLLAKTRGRGPITDTSYLRKIVQSCFDKSITRLQDNGHPEEAQSLLSATVHWLRHTGISDDVKIRPREHVRDDAGHSSSAITDKYIDIELRERHASAKKKRLNLLEDISDEPS